MNMKDVKLRIAKKVRDAIAQTYDLQLQMGDIVNLVQQGGIEGVDVECRIAFRISKELKMKPYDAADGIVRLLDDDYFTVHNKNGYLNFALKDRFYSEFVGEDAPKREKVNAKVIIEYPSINPNKPLHIGHLRNAILGDCVSRLFAFYGYDVVRMDYIDDLGLQAAQSLWRYMGRNDDGGDKFDHWLGREYVEAARAMEKDETVKSEIARLMKRLEAGDEKICKKNREMCSRCVEAQHSTMQSAGIFHNVLVWESDIVNAKLLDESMQLLEKKGILKRSESGKYAGCKVVELSRHAEFKNLKDADKVFVRANGVATYIAKDMAFALWKFGLVDSALKFSALKKQINGAMLYSSASADGKKMAFNRAEKVINIIGVEQQYPQSIIKAVLGLAGFENESKNYVHVSYGHARLKDVRFSGRKGTWKGYTADKLIEESIGKACTLISGRFRDYGEDEKKTIGANVGIGAIRYAFIKLSPEKELIFDWERALNFEGDSGPYLQYSYARAVHILEKEGIDEGWSGKAAFEDDCEKRLIRKIAMFDEVVETAVANIAPHRIAEFAIELCADFNSFYAKCRVVGEENSRDVSESRKRLVNRYMKALKICLELIGVPAVSSM